MSKQSALLTQRRFLPYFVTQAFGAFNDNVYKNVLLILVAFAAPGALGVSTNLFINLAAGLFILPFFLFSAFAGELADKYEKSQFIRIVKLVEIAIMSLAAVAFIFESYMLLLFLLFLMGTQSAFFGPVKYALLPQTLKSNELVSGNALVETGTFLAILLGTIVAGVIANQSDAKYLAAFSVILFAALGYLSARYIPKASAGNPSLKIRFAPVRQMKTTMSIAHKDKVVLQSILGISWFWFLGASYLTQFPNYAKLYLGGNEASVSFLLTLFSIGIALGSLLCDKLSGHRIEPGIVPIGALGLTVFGAHLMFSTPDVAPHTDTFLGFISEPSLWWVFIDLLFIGVFGGIFIVPLYAMMQSRAEETERSQVIAANNIYNSLFMVVSAILAIVLLGVIELSIPAFFFTLAMMNLAVALYVGKQVPVFALRFIIWVLSHSVYRVQHKNLQHIPEQGGALLVSNHVSYVDALLLAGACPRPIRFVMDEDYYHLPVLHYFFRTTRVIPIKLTSGSIRCALNQVKQQLEAGELVCIFPEGQLTSDGDMQPFKRGIDLILKQTPVPVIPIALKGLWGSYFSREGGRALLKFPRLCRSNVEVVAGSPVSPSEASSERLFNDVKALRGDIC
ncbi:acyl-phosphate glycerol 3-phosphate acyltransferase [Enterovibrio norvegicus FF-33]|uniref:MFS transporter n=1 Tax=Enterovibrio norvegicus TaxID=188144 RepID=UPI0003200767|nr:MFS transporter [Enterovibrio norvegicus]OEE68034.1 acyl-phosphate glycerol 3-phosphate acyltransferase [Enterovibrio norvegicus FF-33]OEE74168.1 acyl-phosphate glycerol 3-phosphate acyltransferase [Enterovibrio norvegicus FF-162]